MKRAESILREETEEVRVTEWRFAPGAATGHHRHEHDYVVVYLTEAKLRAVAASGESMIEMSPGMAYFRKAGVEHDVINVGGAPVIFVEIEIKSRRG